MGYLTTKVFQAHPPGSITAFKQTIVYDITAIPFNMLQQFILNIQSTLQDSSTAMEHMVKIYSEKKLFFPIMAVLDGHSM